MTLSSTSSSHDISLVESPQPAVQKNFSCILCAQRKVKCDKAPGGCSNCSKARVPCVYKAPPPPRRRKRGIRELDLHTRLRLYENALRKLGVDPRQLERQELAKSIPSHATSQDDDSPGHATLPHFNGGATVPPMVQKGPTQTGVLVCDEGRSRYLENCLWTPLKAEWRDPKEILDESSDEEQLDGREAPSAHPDFLGGWNILLGNGRATNTLEHIHPQPLQIFKLWQIYLENINPLVKVFHAPTVQQLILEASGHLGHIPKNLEALMFAIYCAAVMSIDEAECKEIMGEYKSVTVRRFLSGVQYALANANFLKSNDVMVLQALVLFLLANQNNDAGTVWTLSGIASRIGQRIGLHRDGEFLGLSPFDVEIRRRLWWQIIFLEGLAEKLAGVGSNIVMGDTKPPLNVNDNDLARGMKEFPRESEGTTEMTFFLIRCHVGLFLKKTLPIPDVFEGSWDKLSTCAVPIDSKEAQIGEFEATFRKKFLLNFDLSIPWHRMCHHVTSAIISSMRLIAHSSKYRNTHPAEIPPADRERILDLSLYIISLQNRFFTSKEMKGFLWHIRAHYHWKAVICLVGILRYHTAAPKADDAWKQVQLVYDFHPNLARVEMRQALPVAIGAMTLKAWEAYVAARGIPDGGEPYFIQLLRWERSESSKSKKTSPRTPPLADPETNIPNLGPVQDTIPAHAQVPDNIQFDANFVSGVEDMYMPDSTWYDFQAMERTEWDDLLGGFKGYVPDGDYFPLEPTGNI